MLRRVMPRVATWLFLSTALLAADNGPRGYYRFPAIHGDAVVFTAEGDLWKIPIGGGNAQRLTSHPAEETRPAISPDGVTLAFSAAYEGPVEVYVMPLGGELPRRSPAAASSISTAPIFGCWI